MAKLKLILSFALLFVFSFTKAQNTAVEKANEMIADKKYASAFEYLHGSDPNNQDPDISILKTNLLLTYFVKTEDYQRFGLKDLLPGQDLQVLRENNTTVRMFDYKPDSILNKLMRQYPQNYKLHKALGNYYYEVHVEYGDNWILPDSVVVENIRKNYLSAYDNKEFDYWSLFGLGYTYLLNEEYEQSIPFLQKSIDLNPNYPLSYYNLAFAYYNTENYTKCLPAVQKAYNMQTIPIYKAEAARLIAMTYEALKDDNKALDYYRTADKILPNDYNTILPLMTLEMKLDDPLYKRHTDHLFFLDPSNPVIFQDIFKAYSENENEKEFIEFMEDLKPRFRQNNTVMANIHLHQAIAQYEMDEWVAAKINFERARSLFRNLFKPSHGVFNVIDSYTNAIRKKNN
ncbi:MAG TPA: tetratricopeptide repeat protein [Bacteroidales bacterium]|nr:tetratricopeptide repeat protein [Bacteroidales bacterium]